MASYMTGIGIADHPAPIFQGLAPTLIGSFSDVAGRRPAYWICFTVYLAANFGARRADQFCGAVHPPMRSPSVWWRTWQRRRKRGRYVGYVTAGVLLWPAFGPLVGGLLTRFLGWRSVFCFLAIVAGVVLVGLLIAFPETCRTIAGHGAVPTTGWNVSAVNWSQLRRRRGWGRG